MTETTDCAHTFRPESKTSAWTCTSCGAWTMNTPPADHRATTSGGGSS